MTIDEHAPRAEAAEVSEVLFAATELTGRAGSTGPTGPTGPEWGVPASPHPPSAVRTVIDATPATLAGASAVARIAAASLARGTSWITRASMATMTEMVRELGSGEPVLDVIDHQVETIRWGAWQLLGLDSAPAQDHRASSQDLRARGDLLLRRSAKRRKDGAEHPAFSRILDELVPDEARIMRFMAVAGPQPSIDVRTKTPLGVGSERVETGINMIADMAGCGEPDRGTEYLGNLKRLGLILFSPEAVADPRRYSFIEAQPKTVTAMAKVKRPHTVYRSVEITTFGACFCDVCFALDGYDAGGWIHDVR